MKAQKTIDTYYPNYYHSSWLDFEQKHLLGWQVTPQDAKDYSFAHSYNEWFASKYSFRNSHLAISQGYGAVGIQWHIGGGCYVITNAQDAQKAEAKAEDEDPLPSESFNQSTNLVLNDLDRGDLSNAINLAVKGELTEDKMIDAVSSLGFSEREGALEVASNLFNSLNEQFNEIADQEGMSPEDARNMLEAWSNTNETSLAVHDWINTGGVDSGRLREAMREAWNAYGKSSNTELVKNLKSDGYEVRATTSGIVIKGNEFSDWTTWREARNVFKA